MAKVFKALSPPRLEWKVEIDGREIDVDELMTWLSESIKKDVYYMMTQFADSKSQKYCVPSRKKHFKDGYYVYTFWFARKADAALFKLFWGQYG